MEEIHIKDSIIRNKIHIIIFILFTSTILISCSKSKLDKIDELDSLSECNPEKALIYIQNKDKINNIKQDMRFKLVKYKIEDKCYIKHNSDSLINQLTDYFDNKGSKHEKIECYYYTGSTYRDLEDYPLAMYWYRKAIEFSETNPIEHRDSIIYAFTLSQIAQIYYEIGDDREASIKEILNTGMSIS